MSSRGQIVIPQEIRKRCGLREGDHFVLEDNPDTQVLTLRKIKRSEDWLEVLMQCPAPLEVPKRKKQFYKPKNGLAD